MEMRDQITVKLENYSQDDRGDGDGDNDDIDDDI
jgi:hypothetical protein